MNKNDGSFIRLQQIEKELIQDRKKVMEHIISILSEMDDTGKCPIKEYRNLGQAGGGYYKCDMTKCEYEAYCKTAIYSNMARRRNEQP